MSGRKLGRAAGPAFLLATAALGASCGPKSDENDGKTGPVPASAFAKAFGQAYCEGLGPCCAQTDLPFAAGTCTQNVTSTIDAAVKAYTSNPKVVFDEDVGGRCIDAYRAAFVACTNRDLRRAVNKACDGLFNGTVPQGGACAEDVECALLPAGENSVSCDTGVCKPYESDFAGPDDRVALGADCRWSCDTFGCSGISETVGTKNPKGACWAEDGLYCSSSTGTCATAPAIGQPCAEYACGTGAYCSVSTCAAQIETGPCPNGNECVATSYCDFTTRACIKRSPNGQPCNDNGQCLSDSCEGDVCKIWTAADPGTCAGVFDD